MIPPFDEEEIKILLDATLRIIESQKKDRFDPTDIHTEIQFLNLFTESLVTRVLIDSKRDKKLQKDSFEYLKNNFRILKECTQEAVAVGFANALQKHSRMPVEYYCIIKIVPEGDSSVTH